MSAALRGAGELFKIVLVALVLAWGLRVFFAEPFHIPSASMQPALIEGDYLLALKPAYGYSRVSFAPIPLPAALSGRFPDLTPRRGDVIVFQNRRDGGRDYVKRVIGLPGERVQMVDGRVFVGGEALPVQALDDVAGHDDDGRPVRLQRFLEEARAGRAYVTTHIVDPATGRPRGFDTTSEFIVPQGAVFVLGDNRDGSIDSRFPRVGYVPIVDVIGRADRVFVSAGAGFRLHNPATWGAFRPSRILAPVDQRS